ncbi:MAG: HPF/RaiA family ribosome-associated protein [Burkholderiaceae bacterium]|jgi:ribosome-associated translation inhibitor RaiA|nr:HPF/RaiA family ribosome-associated protein [Burkholderiaceae bacterium]
MTPTIIAKGVKASESLRNYITARLDTVLTRGQKNVQDITIRLTDTNGPRGGIDKRCQIQVKLPGMSPIVVTGLAADITSAIDMAAQRVSKAVSRVLSRAKSIPHVSMPLYIKKSFLAT